MKRVRSTDVAAGPKIKLMLDSGAFSAWSKGETIDIDDYIDYIEEHLPFIERYVALDVIPGKPGQERTIEMAEEAAAASFKNYKYMRKAGLKPIPVVHLGEQTKWVFKYIDDGCDYVGLSPSTGLIAKVDSIGWLDKIFTHITDSVGIPMVKTHGFAVASFDMMKRYPWTTCDATSWALTAAFGGIYVPAMRSGKMDYAQSPVKISVSHYEDRNKIPTDHISKQGPFVRQWVGTFLQQCGTSLDEVAKDYEARARVVVHVMLKFQDAIGDVKFKHRMSSLMDKAR